MAAILQTTAWHVNGCQAIIWTNDGFVHWRMHALLNLCVLTSSTIIFILEAALLLIENVMMI